MAVYQLGDRSPQIDPSAFIHESAVVIGDARLHAEVSVWPGATVRGDNEPIVIGPRSNVQESCTLHTDPGYPLRIGTGVTIGHQAMLHGCTVGDGSLIGIQAVVLNGATIGRNCLIGAGALVTEGKNVPDGSLFLGSPGKVVRPLTEDEIAGMRLNNDGYVHRAQHYRAHLHRIA